MDNLTKILDALKNRRIWSGVVGVAGFLLVGFGINIEDADTLIQLLTNLGAAITPLVAAVLALLSFFKPKK